VWLRQDRAKMDELKKQGWTMYYRGVRGKKYTEQFRTGPLCSGSGYFGNGTYAQKVMKPGPEGEEAAKRVARAYGPDVVRIALPPTARVIPVAQLRQELSAYQQALRNEHASGAITKAAFDTLEALTRDLGRFAALHNYDAIEATADGYFVLLNRTILAVEDKDQ
jgi:hypothetical protein